MKKHFHTVQLLLVVVIFWSNTTISGENITGSWQGFFILSSGVKAEYLIIKESDGSYSFTIDLPDENKTKKVGETPTSYMENLALGAPKLGKPNFEKNQPLLKKTDPPQIEQKESMGENQDSRISNKGSSDFPLIYVFKFEESEEVEFKVSIGSRIRRLGDEGVILEIRSVYKVSPQEKILRQK